MSLRIRLNIKDKLAALREIQDYIEDFNDFTIDTNDENYCSVENLKSNFENIRNALKQISKS